MKSVCFIGYLSLVIELIKCGVDFDFKDGDEILLIIVC